MENNDLWGDPAQKKTENKEDNKKTLTLKIPTELHSRFKSYAASRRTTMTKILISLMEDWINT